MVVKNIKIRDGAHRGFTIVELLIVIVVIGVLAALVLNTYSGIQARARDQERLTDLKAIQKHLEIYYIDNGHYPIDQQMKDELGYQFMRDNFIGLSPETLLAPGAEGSTSFMNNGAPTKESYRYYAYQEGPADSVGCYWTATPPAPSDPSPTDCAKYELLYFSEVENDVVLIRSLNGWTD
jgi:prepilin-type N-terminal cleavage/methylation domain-containing protein